VRKAGSGPTAKQTILFSNDAEVIKRERAYIYSRAKEEQPVEFFNNGHRGVSAALLVATSTAQHSTALFSAASRMQRTVRTSSTE
jgi:hypothetical protein